MAERLARKPRGQETIDDYLMYLRHLAVYKYVLSHFEASPIIDLGCGTGYGTRLIGQRNIIVGLDLAASALPTEEERGEAHFCVADVCDLPFKDAPFELAISFQVIEHIRNVNLYLQEAHRVLSNKGILLLSTPNRRLRLLPLERPHNPYHVREYGPQELRLLLKRHFPIVDILGLHAMPHIESRERESLRKGRRWYYRHLILAKLKSFPLGGYGIIAARRVKRLLKPVTSGGPHQSTQINPNAAQNPPEDVVSPEDYWINSLDLKSALDLIAICKK